MGNQPTAANKRKPSNSERKLDFDIIVHVYNLINTRGNRLVEAIVGSGIYHSGIEIDGVEYAFGCLAPGMVDDARYTGVWVQQPGTLPPDWASSVEHEVALPMGSLRCSRMEVYRRIRRLRSEWRAADYDILGKNCNHFVAYACNVFEVSPPPQWINQLADIGTTVSKGISRMLSFGNLQDAPAIAVNAVSQPNGLSRSRSLDENLFRRHSR